MIQAIDYIVNLIQTEGDKPTESEKEFELPPNVPDLKIEHDCCGYITAQKALKEKCTTKGKHLLWTVERETTYYFCNATHYYNWLCANYLRQGGKASSATPTKRKPATKKEEVVLRLQRKRNLFQRRKKLKLLVRMFEFMK